MGMLLFGSLPSVAQNLHSERTNFVNFHEITDPVVLTTMEHTREYFHPSDTLFTLWEYTEVIYFNKYGCDPQIKSIIGKMIRYDSSVMQVLQLDTRRDSLTSPVFQQTTDQAKIREVELLANRLRGIYKQDNRSNTVKCATGVILVTKGEEHFGLVSPGGFFFLRKESFPSSSWVRMFHYLARN